MNSLFFTVWNIGKCRTRGLLSGNRKRYCFFVKSIFKNKELIVDFFREIIISLGAYGCYQPGCYDVFDIVACSHSRAHQYYMASIKDALCLADRVCHGDPKFVYIFCLLFCLHFLFTFFVYIFLFTFLGCTPIIAPI